jgi:hypothetical protein
MLKAIALLAFRLDTWLEQRLGRPYNAALSVGLIAEVIHNLADMPAKLRFTEHLFWELFQTAFACILLVHQIGALSHRFQARDDRVAGH